MCIVSGVVKAYGYYVPREIIGEVVNFIQIIEELISSRFLARISAWFVDRVGSSPTVALHVD